MPIPKPDSADCDPGEIGELFFLPAGSDVPSHYLGAEIRENAGGWVSIGDLGYLDADGYVFLADRRTDLILRGGAYATPVCICAEGRALVSIATSGDELARVAGSETPPSVARDLVATKQVQAPELFPKDH